jgi:hypothetical protein
VKKTLRELGLPERRGNCHSRIAVVFGKELDLSKHGEELK